MNEISYPYGFRLKRWIYYLLLMGAMGAWSLGRALARPYPIDFIGIDLPASRAVALWWTFAVVSILAFGAIAYLVLFSLLFKNAVTLQEDGLTMPKVILSRSQIGISYASIERLDVTTRHTPRGQIRTLRVHHHQGWTLILEEMLPSPQAFDEVCARLHSQSKAST
jgi:hypothetical protein